MLWSLPVEMEGAKDVLDSTIVELIRAARSSDIKKFNQVASQTNLPEYSNEYQVNIVDLVNAIAVSRYMTQSALKAKRA